ncbi:MAG: serine/threonine protein kinase [Deltaproteobacteria bacterium]|nr:serine/threonine protein kinase [Deltaproteobacteria bacterium]
MVDYLDDRYEMGAMLGEGAMGKVFAAHDRHLGIDVAVKIMNPELARSKRNLTRFSNEVKTCQRMCSPHVVKVVGIAVTREDVPCMVTELLEGESLEDRLEREGGLSVAETCEIVKQTARALARAHNCGVIHRDVKPGNIFLTKDEGGRLLVKLIDFGIATTVAADGTYSSGDLAGTIEYMAPEVLLGTHEASIGVDVYALACVAFECLTGRLPVQGEFQQVIRQLREGSGETLTEHRPDLEGAVDDCIARGLHPDPYWRYSTARDFANAFEKAVEASRVAATAAIVAVGEGSVVPMAA